MAGYEAVWATLCSGQMRHQASSSSAMPHRKAERLYQQPGDALASMDLYGLTLYVFLWHVTTEAAPVGAARW